MKLEDLSKPLPKEAITKHPTKTYLNSIKAIYVTERFNEVFGVGKWTVKVNEISRNDEGMVVVKAIFEVPEIGIYYESFGGNDNGGVNNKNFDLGDAYKGATTDALTKIGSYLGVGIDVFKGLSDVPKTEVKITWLSDENFNKAMNSDEKGIEATLRKYNTETHKMKKDYKISLEAQLQILKNQ